MIKTHRFDGFRFSFIQIARLLKNIFRCCRRLVWEFSFLFKIGIPALTSTRLPAGDLIALCRCVTGKLKERGASVSRRFMDHSNRPDA
jgi:hypothetical protein